MSPSGQWAGQCHDPKRLPAFNPCIDNGDNVMYSCTSKEDNIWLHISMSTFLVSPPLKGLEKGGSMILCGGSWLQWKDTCKSTIMQSSSNTMLLKWKLLHVSLLPLLHLIKWFSILIYQNFGLNIQFNIRCYC